VIVDVSSQVPELPFPLPLTGEAGERKENKNIGPHPSSCGKQKENLGKDRDGGHLPPSLPTGREAAERILKKVF